VFPIGAFCVGAISEAWGVSTAFFVQGATGLTALTALALWWRREGARGASPTIVPARGR
jgi:hypothetical protein